jgi:hypothetical protein
MNLATNTSNLITDVEILSKEGNILLILIYDPCGPFM